MLRKLLLVGLVMIIDRGSVAQNLVALVLSFLFFALQTATQPYKLPQDNAFRAATEFHVFLVILAGLVLRNEQVDESWYDWGLVVSFLVLVPGAFVVTVVAKVRSLSRPGSEKETKETTVLISPSLHGSFHRLAFGFANQADRKKVHEHVDDTRKQLDPNAQGKQVWSNKKFVAHLKADEMRSMLEILELGLPKSEALGYHFTDLNSARLILQGKGIRASTAGQLGGGVSVCVKSPVELGWDAYCT